MPAYTPPGGSSTELQARNSVGLFQAVTGTSWDGTVLVMPSYARFGDTLDFTPSARTVLVRCDSSISSGQAQSLRAELHQTVAFTGTGIALSGLAYLAATSGTVESLKGLNGVVVVNASGSTATSVSGVEGKVAVQSGTGTIGFASALRGGDSGHAQFTTSAGLRLDLQTSSANLYQIWSGTSTAGEFLVVPGGNTYVHNPVAAGFSPGDSNYERAVVGWSSNVVQLGAQAGGTGTLRGMQLLGSYVAVGGSTAAGELRILEPSGSGTNYVSLISPTREADLKLTLPSGLPAVNQVLEAASVSGSDVTLGWATAGSGSVATDTIWDAKGDLAVGTGANTASRLAVGTNGQVLSADSAEATGLKWITLPGGGDALTANPLSQFAATTSLQLKGVISDETGSGALVFATSPTLVTPVLGVASATSLELSNTGLRLADTNTSHYLVIAPGSDLTADRTLTITTGDAARTLDISAGSVTISAAAATVLDDASVSAMVDTLGGAASTGSGGLVRTTSATLVSPALGTPTSGTLTNCTGLPISSGVSGLGTNVATFLGTPSSANLAACVTDETGSGLLVFATSPTITTPTISGAITFPDDVRQTFNPGTTNAGINVGALAGDPSTPSNGDLWYDSTANELTARINGANVALGAGGAGTPGGSDTQVQFNDASAFGGDAGLTYNKTTDTLTAGNLVLTNDLPIAQGGTAASTAPAARTNLGSLVVPGLCQHRLSLEETVSFSTSDQTGKTTVYLVPHLGNLIAIYDGTNWEYSILPEIGITIGTKTSGKNYDIFAFTSSATPSSTDTGTDTLTFGSATGWETGAVVRTATTGGGLTAGTDYWYRAASATTGTLHATLAGAIANTGKTDLTASITQSLTSVSMEFASAWTSDTARADAIARQNGAWVKSGTTTRLYLGTIRTTSTTATADADATRYCWNHHNRLPKRCYRAYSTSHTVQNIATREYDNGTSVRAEWIIGLADQTVTWSTSARCTSASVTPAVILYGSLDTTAYTWSQFYQGSTNNYQVLWSTSNAIPSIGYHYFTIRESESGNVLATLDQAYTLGRIDG